MISGYVITEGGQVLVQTYCSGGFGFELWSPPYGEWDNIILFNGDHLAALGSWTRIPDNDPRITFSGYAKAYAELWMPTGN